ncbi:hypothetical protein SpCBS45565_g02739 [Spizellomyces sp. 'palustris']|nr:hypothetical protein SpCBS45565_g02739 [Spizellomyces sp. 'palustris']
MEEPPAVDTKCLSIDPRSFPWPAQPADTTSYDYLYAPASPLVLNPPPTPTYQADLTVLQHAADILRSNNVVAFPTETVYGLGANALNADAVAKIFRAKGRPSDNPLIVHVSSLKMLESLLPLSSPHIPSVYTAAIAKAWPGPLTILLPRGPQVPLAVTGGHDTVAVRFPSHPIARALIEACGFPLAAPSANTSGRPSPTLASHVLADLAGRVPLILNGGPCGYGVESTVLDGLATPPAVLRPGGITVEELKGLPGLEKLRVYRRDFVDTDMEAAPTTPGMKYRHYTPEAEVILFELAEQASLLDSGAAKLRNAVNEYTMTHLVSSEDKPKVGIMRTGLRPCSQGDDGEKREALSSGVVMELYLGETADMVARELFKGLRTLEERGAQIILVEGVPEEREGLAVMNRLRKAASRVITIS